MKVIERVRPRIRSFPIRTVGILVLVLAVVGLAAVYQKERISTLITPGDTVRAHFERVYKLSPYRNEVKLAGTVVGTVTGEEWDEDAHASTVSMKLDPGIIEKLGSAPSAHIRPTLLLGGKYYVDLVGGGAPDEETEEIPLERTSVPVELDRVLSSLNRDAREGLRGTVAKSDEFLVQDGSAALRDLLASAPGTLRPAGGVLDAARGTRPDQDLTATVTGFERLASALTADHERVARISEGMRDTAAALGQSSPALRDTVNAAPATLRTTRDGLADLQPTLAKLTETAPKFRDSAQALGPLLDELDPTLARTNTLVAGLRPLLADVRPTVDSLVPTSEQATKALDDVKGPVLDRINGPIKDRLFSPFHGTGAFEGGGANGNLLYEEVGFLASHLTSTFSVWDSTGAVARLTAGAGGNSAGGAGFPPSVEQLQEGAGVGGPPGPQGNPPLKAPLDQPGGDGPLNGLGALPGPVNQQPQPAPAPRTPEEGGAGQPPQPAPQPQDQDSGGLSGLLGGGGDR